MLRRLLVASCLNAPLVGAPAWAQNAEPDVGDALTQPLRDLSILRRETPEVLQRAAIAPYADGPTLENGVLDCPSVATEIASLDQALGDDLRGRTPEMGLMAQAQSEAGNAIVDAVGDLVELPYRGVIRRITGAHRRDAELQGAVQAGLVRRAFLKGLSARECAALQEVAAVEPAPAPPLSDLELAHRQLAAADAAAAARFSNVSQPVEITPDGDVTFVATETVQSDYAPAQMQLAEANPVVTIAASEAPLSDLALARRQLAEANAAAAARLGQNLPIESVPIGSVLEISANTRPPST